MNQQEWEETDYMKGWYNGLETGFWLGLVVGSVVGFLVLWVAF